MSTTTEDLTPTEFADLLFDQAVPALRMAALAVAAGRVPLDEVAARFSALTPAQVALVPEVADTARRRQAAGTA